MLNVDDVRRLFDYDQATGLLIWKITKGSRVISGKVAGRTDSHGHRQVGVMGNKYMAHRLVWLHVHGSWPDGQIDHINGARNDNRICNLRVVTNSQNQQNQRRARSDNLSSGILGVYRKGNRFYAHIGVNGKLRYIGAFDTAELAKHAYLSAKRELHTHGTI